MQAKKVRTKHKHSRRCLVLVLCGIVFAVFSKAQPSKVWYLLCFRSSLEQSIVFTLVLNDQPSKVCYLLMFSKLPKVHHVAEIRAGTRLTCWTSSGSSYLEPNLERQRMFGAKPRAGTQWMCQTSGGSSCFGAKPRAGFYDFWNKVGETRARALPKRAVE